ncbi:hypothetical protein ALC60_04048 [Trachymyrmex zeteki]|uniref:Uncharacterized protein n=1 Tax=Mycetomoellerius zeteki TaxID=64791 RepID=A0A151X9R7_9HYME|nr:hypothetical protein ALC60_04048 [Trachymyrmex zeteki]
MSVDCKIKAHESNDVRGEVRRINTFQKIGGTEGMKDGKIVAKNLLAIFFTKELLKQCFHGQESPGQRE